MSHSEDLMNVAALATLVREGRCRPVDCRFDLLDAGKGRRDFEAGHIPGAVYADMDRDLAGPVTAETGRHPLPDVNQFRHRLSAWGIGDDTLVVAYDNGNGSLASRLWWMLRCWLGHERVALLDGGIAAWTEAGEGLSTDPAEPTLASYTRHPDNEVIATTAEIAALVSSGEAWCLVDARDPARFRGEYEPIDPVAGHIPGARNMPLTLNLTSDGRWRKPPELGEIWREHLAAAGERRPVVMCGSGVTACHLALAARQAGLPTPRLYVGSWSEWVRDTGRPVAVAT